MQKCGWTEKVISSVSLLALRVSSHPSGVAKYRFVVCCAVCYKEGVSEDTTYKVWVNETAQGECVQSEGKRGLMAQF